MEQNDKVTLPSTSSVGRVFVVKEDTAAAGASTNTTTPIQGEENKVLSSKVCATEEQFHSVFGNALIADNILSYLTFGDMKVARQVSRSLLETVESNKRFKDAQVLLVTKGKCPLSELNGLLGSGRIWRGIKIDVAFPSEDLMKIPGDILKDVEFVCLESKSLGERPVPVLPLRHILSSTTKITRLLMGIQVFVKQLSNVISCNEVQKNLQKLNHFEILGHTNGIYVCDHVRDSIAKTLLQLAPLAENDEVNTGILKQLKSLHLPKVVFSQRKRNFQIAVMNVLRGNFQTLRKLTVHLDIWVNAEITAVTLPHLTFLKVKVKVRGQDNLKGFLANHPSLEELDVSAENKMKRSLWDVIKERSAHFKKLHLETKKFVDSEGKLEERVDWTFLAGMTRLKDFALVRPYEVNAKWLKFGSGGHILDSLPKNQLERLSFIGISGRDIDKGFWSRWDAQDIPDKLEVLRGFRNLKRLSVRGCPKAVDDDVMQFFVAEMTSLEELEVSKSLDLTDHGIFGRDSEDGSHSIRNLKGLKEFRIRKCPLVTSQRVLSSLELPFLQRFTYLAETPVSKSSVMRMMSKNPSLESVSINFEGSSEDVLKEVNNSRLETLVNLDELSVSDDGYYGYYG